MTPSPPTHEDFLREAIDLAVTSVQVGGGPFGAVIVRQGGIIARGENRVTSSHDPTAHAEIVAIRTACSQLASHSLAACTLYASCEPCPMCLGAVLWSRLEAVYYAASQKDAAAAGFDDARFYEALLRKDEGLGIPCHQMMTEAATLPFEAWKNRNDRIEY